MVTSYLKGESVKLSEHFSTTDFDCQCSREDCVATYIDSDLIAALEYLRLLLAGEIKILSGFRCTAHNLAVGGKPGSQHLQGKAADIKCKKLSPVEVAGKCASVSQFRSGGVGVYPTFVHLDVRGYPARWMVKRQLSAV